MFTQNTRESKKYINIYIYKKNNSRENAQTAAFERLKSFPGINTKMLFISPSLSKQYIWLNTDKITLRAPEPLLPSAQGVTTPPQGLGCVFKRRQC